MPSENITLYDKNDKIIDVMVLPDHYMEGAPVRDVMVEGRRFVEGGGPNSFYGRGQFAEVVDG